MAPSFPAECRYVLETRGEVYRFDAEAKAQWLTLPSDSGIIKRTVSRS